MTSLLAHAWSQWVETVFLGPENVEVMWDNYQNPTSRGPGESTQLHATSELNLAIYAEIRHWSLSHRVLTFENPDALILSHTSLLTFYNVTCL